ncbi:uroporphyrinogen-III C-methyltransferase [Lutibacter sp. HS1-25]|uniref:uroporphyrinogen-III C-methyltransferase n=1 Tax=Lutibacter sp. HS1-25 TaxID=2485000 RepID=UPI0010110A1D|nr:uroporphyrinogen-III C-methyltransferase [Lutibacter sp. HS1-25]RXP55472.1 uroporphyrinogen-III C-methyltransferase [Lutibacter sp. HS1-25]
MKTKKNNPKVTLVGAGPGDKDLITLKAVKAIEQADFILYDALVNPEILAYAKKSTPTLYVGKRFNNHAFSQDEINQLLVNKAFEYGHVVRLKGGDSFVFGRGSEEIDFIESYAIETAIVPGISSALAVPALQGIPLTKRNVNESFWVITGTTSNGEISKDITLGAQSSATLVILMGLRNFSLIAEEIKKFRHKYTPFAIIQNGSLPNETITIETINNYKNTIDKIDYKSPGIIVIGDVVTEHSAFLDEEIQRVLSASF